ncbi:MAG: bifunctional proline dehydrogenase/L-glutamate gamma-semialdehyde dehydrogenase PutA [Pseudomonadota bacterium]
MAADADSLETMRAAVRANALKSESELAKQLIQLARLDDATRARARDAAAHFVNEARADAQRSGLIDKFLQEYGLSSAEGVTLMRLAEALLRTPDAATANALIEDKIEAGDWAAHKGKSPFPLVNFSTRALMLTAAWLDDVEAKDPMRRMAKATKAVLDRLGEPVIRASVAQAMRIMGEHFVLGESIKEAMARSERYARDGYRFSFDMLGEAAHTAGDAERYFRDYESAIAAIADHAKHDRPADNPGISVKLSALHPRYEYGKKERVLSELAERARVLARQARKANIGFNIDAEEADRLDISLDLIEQLIRDPSLDGWTGFGVVVQAYQRRAPFVLDWLATLARSSGRRIMVRLVKGAYWDAEIKRAQVLGLSSYPVFTRKAMTDLSYIACARKMLSSTDAFYPQFATHNALTATTVMEMAGDYADYEFQRLHGMGDALHDRLLKAGLNSRIYAPVGGHKELLPYLVRRLLENGANSSFVNQLIDPDLSVDDIVADPIDAITSLSAIENTQIPAPRDYLGGRLAAKGWDITDPLTADHLVDQLAQAEPNTDAKPIIDADYDSEEATPVYSPSDRTRRIGTVVECTPEDIANACASAAAYASEWAATPRSARAAILRKAADRLDERGDAFMTIAVREAGKTWEDAIAEIREAVDFLRYYADQAESAAGAPLGVVACISPWNFPLAIFLGQISGALAAGNCVVAKPAEQTPLIAYEAVRLLHEAGAPKPALQFTPGDGSIGASLVSNDAIEGVIFTGSTQTARAIRRTLLETNRINAPLIAETGGVNAMIIDSTALLEQAVSDLVASSFQSAGQRCSACRVACVQDDIFDRFEDMLTGSIAELSVDDPAKLSTDVGPVIDVQARSAIDDRILDLEKSSRLMAKARIKSEANGLFIAPVAFEISSVNALGDEIFGPVLQVVRFEADRLDALIGDINRLGYGLTMGVHTRIDETMNAIARRARVGNLYVNRNQIGAVVGVQPFGGEGLSGTGPKAGGPHYVQSLSKPVIIEGGGELVLTDTELSREDHQFIDHSHAAYFAWSLTDRAAVLSGALERLDSIDNETRDDILATARASSDSEDLPGPTGESNTLKLRGRGLALCLGGDGDVAHQALKALAAGNIVIAFGAGELSDLARALSKSGAPDGVFRSVDAIPTALLQAAPLRLVVFDGDRKSRLKIAEATATPDGPIIPILSRRDPVSRFCTERTMTVNTTAAGGDVRLLALAD